MNKPLRVNSDAIAPDTTGLNFYTLDRSLQDLLDIHLEPRLRAHVEPHLVELGGLVGGRLDECARLADRHTPILHQRDKFGRDVQTIEYHPAYRELEDAAFGRFGIHALSHRKGVMGWPDVYPAAAKHAFTYLFNQAEFGMGCPINVTDGSAMLLSRYGDDALKAKYLDGLTSTDMGVLTQGAQFMTEKEGGSDVGSLTTVARLEDVGECDVESQFRLQAIGEEGEAAGEERGHRARGAERREHAGGPRREPQALVVDPRQIRHRQSGEERDSPGEALGEVDLAAHRAVRDRGHRGLDAFHVGDLVDALDRDQRRVHVHRHHPDAIEPARRGDEGRVATRRARGIDERGIGTAAEQPIRCGCAEADRHDGSRGSRGREALHRVACDHGRLQDQRVGTHARPDPCGAQGVIDGDKGSGWKRTDRHYRDSLAHESRVGVAQSTNPAGGCAPCVQSPAWHRARAARRWPVARAARPP